MENNCGKVQFSDGLAVKNLPQFMKCLIIILGVESGMLEQKKTLPRRDVKVKNLLNKLMTTAVCPLLSSPKVSVSGL